MTVVLITRARLLFSCRAHRAPGGELLNSLYSKITHLSLKLLKLELVEHFILMPFTAEYTDIFL